MVKTHTRDNFLPPLERILNFSCRKLPSISVRPLDMKTLTKAKVVVLLALRASTRLLRAQERYLS